MTRNVYIIMDTTDTELGTTVAAFDNKEAAESMVTHLESNGSEFGYTYRVQPLMVFTKFDVDAYERDDLNLDGVDPDYEAMRADLG